MKRVFVRSVASGVLFAAAAGASAQQASLPPVAQVRPVTTDYFGTTVVDDYRYFEKLTDPGVQAWMKGQAAYTRARLDAIPGRQALQARIHTLLNTDLRRGGFVRRGERYFYERVEPGAQSPKLVYRDGFKGDEHLLLDPAALGKGTKTHYALDYFQPSWDGTLVAYGVSSGGSEASVMHVMDVATGADRAEAIDRTGGSVVAWRPDNRSFFYLRYVKPTAETPASETMSNARAYLHTLGTRIDGEGDPAVFGRGVSRSLDVPEGQGTYIVLDPGSPYAVAVANHNMDDNPATFFVASLAEVTDSGTPWRKVADVGDGVTHIRLRGDTLFFLSQKNAPRFRLLGTSLAKPDVANARVVVAEGAGVLTDLSVAREGLYVREREGAVSRVRRVSLDGAQGRVVPMPFEGNVGVPVTDPREPGALIGVRGWLQSQRLMAYDPAADVSTDTGLVLPSSIDASQMESKEVFATSHDGTRIPLSLIYRKGLKLDGSHPTFLIGYGSYGVSIEPSFNPARLAWLEHDGIVAIAHVRGGGEYGEGWHVAGQKLMKPNTILDFIACGQYLVDQGYTTPRRLVGQGASAGGITVGGALTQRPDLFGVIIDQVGVSDTLRSETEPNGPPNVPEFGSTSTEAGFHGLYAMSAYAQVRDGTAYPAVMFVTGANDPRVAPWHMMKMAARVQAATSSSRPVLLRIDYDAGHGIGSSSSQYENELADIWAFSLWQMGDPAFQP
jgi:prolyl oligopeptidase